MEDLTKAIKGQQIKDPKKSGRPKRLKSIYLERDFEAPSIVVSAATSSEASASVSQEA